MKTALSSLILLSMICSQAFAGFEGIYVGASGGVANEQASFRIARSSPSVPAASENNQYTRHHGWAEIYAGWGEIVCSQFYFGGRLGWDYACYEITDPQSYITTGSPATFVNSTASLKLNTAEFFADFKPGWVLSRSTMVFGLFGVAVDRYTVEDQNSGSASLINTSFGAKKSKNKAALRLGFGFDQCFLYKIHFVASYIYTAYQSVSVGQFIPGVASGPTSTSLTVKPRKSVGSLGLAYYF